MRDHRPHSQNPGIAMRKIVLFIASSLDGYIARSNGEIDWLYTDQNYGYTKFLDSIDTVLMGRKTYEQVLTLGANWMSDLQFGYGSAIL